VTPVSMSWRIGCSKSDLSAAINSFSATGTEILERGPPFLYFECERLLMADFVAEIGLQRARGRLMPFFEAVRCHPLDCAGDLRSTLLTLATVTQRTQGRLVVAGRPAWQACEGSAQSLPT
jgi:hypothetical protein